MRDFRRFFLESSPEAAGLVLFFAALVASDLAGAFEAVEAGAFPAVEAGLGAIAMKKLVKEAEEDEGRWRWEGEIRWGTDGGCAGYIYGRVGLVWSDASTH